MSGRLSVRGLTLGYGRADVVRGLDLEVAAGTIVTLIGANGAGKTTSLRGLSGLIRPRRGTVELDGQPITGLAAHKIARLGLIQVPEGRQVFPELTVAENLRLGAFYVTDGTELRRRLDRVLARFPRLGERLGQLAGLMSGGEQQMLAMGRALMAEPKVLLLDEPSMGLAPLFIEEIFAIIAALRREGRTILLVEQNARAALDLADQASVLENGAVTLAGPAAEIAANPAVIAAYLGA